MGNTISFLVHVTQIVLGRGIPLFSSGLKQFDRLLVVLFNPLSIDIHHSQIILGFFMSLFSS